MTKVKKAKKTIKKQYIIDYLIAQVDQNYRRVDNLTAYYFENKNLSKDEIDDIHIKKNNYYLINSALCDVIREIKRN